MCFMVKLPHKLIPPAQLHYSEGRLRRSGQDRGGDEGPEPEGYLRLFVITGLPAVRAADGVELRVFVAEEPLSRVPKDARRAGF